MRASRNAFTLIELLAVIAVLALLAGLLLPVLARLRERARRTSCLSNLRQIAQAEMLYLQDWDERFSGWWQGGPERPEPFGPHRFWPELLEPYLAHRAVFDDPGYSRMEPPPLGLKLADYALLTRGPSGLGTDGAPYWRWPGPPLSLAHVVRPTETLQVTEGYTTTLEIQGLVARHSGGMNASFLDGHVRWLTRSQALQITSEATENFFQRRRYFYRYIAADW
jgi:prepilin-type processing-associated H-X9-DG protein/prepilin-type N-terminal cleavage/methylation domain-containing protein